MWPNHLNFHMVTMVYSANILISYVVFVQNARKPTAALMYRIGLPSNTATPLAPFVRIELLYFFGFIRRQTCLTMNMATAARIMV